MSSSDIEFRPARRAVLRAGVAAGLSLTLAGCFRPLYSEQSYATGPSAKGEVPVLTNLRRIDVRPIEGRIGNTLRNELIFQLRGGGAADATAYRLDISIANRAQSPIVDPFTGQPETRSVSLSVDYALKPAGQIDPVISGQEFASASYSYTLQRFADIRAERDAQNRAAVQIAGKLRNRLQGYFATGR
ncbi:LPS assembly lipoprotein LptE [Methylopila sp. 73B]|uniref:LPS assembly lipoprotein LptE n=1 Tax=Methylopila sp. 73B TaxID=1120792 RepID=UPI00035F0276|nr:LPS assembly lipoprotein LptE [Methylopila sp. 73B]